MSEFLDFQYLDKITFNLDNYKDFSHYSPKISNLLIEYISQGKYEITSKEENFNNIEILKNKLKIIIIFNIRKCNFYLVVGYNGMLVAFLVWWTYRECMERDMEI